MKTGIWGVVGVLLGLWGWGVAGNDHWTWSYKKRWTQAQAQHMAQEPELVFAREGVPHFTQLIFSWNAHRPERGGLVFFVRARDGLNKKWYQWHRAAEWGVDSRGNSVQRSHASSQDQGTRYVYVRLELPEGRHADAFQIKVVPINGARLSSMRALSATASNVVKFLNQSVNKGLIELPAVAIEGVPAYSQMALNHPDRKRICSPTSLSMLIGTLTQRPVDPLAVARGVYDPGLDAYGSWPFNTAHAFDSCGGSVFFRVVRLQDFAALHEYLRAGTPVVVSVRGVLRGGPQEYKSGHLLLVTGWNPRKQVVICHDPAFDADDKVRHEYDIRDFLRAWERSHRLAYVAERRW